VTYISRENPVGNVLGRGHTLPESLLACVALQAIRCSRVIHYGGNELANTSHRRHMTPDACACLSC